MSEQVLLFQNRMGVSNWGYMALGFALAVVATVFMGRKLSTPLR